MGIFSHKPKAQLTVTLNEEAQDSKRAIFWPPYSKVPGHVRLTDCGPQEHRNDMTIVLYGVSKVEWTENHGHRTDRYKSHAPVLTIPQPVSAPTLMPDGSTVWSFTVNVPDKCSLQWGNPPVPDKDNDYWDRDWKAAEKFEDGSDMDLVPSCGIDDHYVHYRVAALLHVNAEKEKHSQIFGETEIFFTVGPDAYHESPVVAADRLVIKSALLAAGNAGHRNKLSFGEKASAMFHSSDLPHFTFSYSAMAPTQAARGEPLRLTLTCRPDPGPSDAPEPDMITVDYVEVELRRLLYFRAPDIFNTEKARSDIRAVFKQKLEAGTIPPLSRRNNWSVVAQTNAVDVANPDFASSNLRCDYDLEVNWHLRCADVKEKVTVYVNHVNMYSQIGVAPRTVQMPPIQ